MAIATETVTENGTETQSKRKRVDLDKLAAENPHEKVVLAFHIPAEMRVQVRKLAEEADISESQYVRDILADKIGYTVPESFNERKRRAGTMSDEEKKEATATKRNNVAALLAAVQQNAASNPELMALLEANGISLDNLPKVRGPRAKHDDDGEE